MRLNNAYSKCDIPSLSAGYNRCNIGDKMFKLILTCLTIPLVVYLTITMLVLVSPILIGGLMYLTYQANRREIA